MTFLEAMLQSWKVLSSRYILDRWWLKVREDRVILPSGHEIPEFHVLEYPDWTMLLGLDGEGHLVLVEQYRHGIGRLSLEFPSGMLEQGEKPVVGAVREFEEETGHIASNVQPIGTLVEDPSRHNNTAYAFFSRDVKNTSRINLDETEDLILVCLTPKEVHQAILSGRMVHGLHIGTFYRAIAQGLITIE
jgi:8-oxo-dGTP pyrophosphatase MutT (NUDIX family)